MPRLVRLKIQNPLSALLAVELYLQVLAFRRRFLSLPPRRLPLPRRLELVALLLLRGRRGRMGSREEKERLEVTRMGKRKATEKPGPQLASRFPQATENT